MKIIIGKIFKIWKINTTNGKKIYKIEYIKKIIDLCIDQEWIIKKIIDFIIIILICKSNMNHKKIKFIKIIVN